MTAWVVSIFYVVGFLLAAHAIMTARTSQGAIAWAVSLVAFPFASVPAYLVLGRSKFQGMTESYDARQDEIDEVIEKARDNLDPWIIEAGEFSATYEAMRKLSGMRLTRGNDVELLIDGDATFDSILAGIAEAKEYALVQFYKFNDDGLGNRMKDVLIERAKAGVRVYMLYDEVGSLGLPDRYINELREAGVETSSFKPTQGKGNRFQLNFRNHRKIVVVDGVTGWIGGHNVGDEYVGLDPKLTPWRDTHVRIEGPAVIQLQAVTVGDWYWATRDIPELTWAPHEAKESDTAVMIYPSAPDQRLETAGLMFVAALHSAKERIWISAPYFVPDEAVMKALELAALRGVDVRIITTGKSDSVPVYLAAFHYINLLRGLGIKFYAFKPGFLHEKVFLIDNRVSAVGTANFDNRSFRLNFEVTALIADDDFAQEMEVMFENDFAHSEVIDPNIYDQKSFLWRLGVNLSRLSSPVL